MNITTTPESTLLLFYDDTYLTTATATLLAIDEDERGVFALLDETIVYPQSGGQPSDHGSITLDDRTCAVTDARYDGPRVRHYGGALDALRGREGDTVEVEIDRDRRLLHAAYHTAGHWLAAIVAESLAVPTQATNGYHFPEGAYMTFEENGDVDWEAVIDEIPMALLIDRQSDLLIEAEIPEPSGDGAARGGPGGRAARFVRIGPDYAAIPCGGTHLASVREVGIVRAGRTKRKNGQTRLYYTVA